MPSPLSAAPEYVARIVVDALQVSSSYSGVGAQTIAIGGELADAPDDIEIVLRCAAATAPRLAAAFPARTRVETPLRRSRPRLVRIGYQQLMAPLFDDRATLLVCLGDQGPVWGRARTLLVINDVRRLVAPRSSGRLESLYYRLLVPRAARHARSLATISRFSQRELVRVLGEDVGDRVSVIAHHPQPRVAAPAARDDRRGFLVVGALRRYKGAETVIEALAEVGANRRPRITFAGPDEGHEPALRSLAAAHGVAKNVSFLGWVDDATLDEERNRALATINPSTYEGYGLTVAESLAHGLPTIASDIPPHREVGRNSVVYFPPGDAPALAEALRSVETDEQRWSELARAALERARELTHERPTWLDVILTSARSRGVPEPGAP